MFTLKEVLNFIEKNPKVRAINQNVEQKSPPPIKVDGGSDKFSVTIDIVIKLLQTR
jgi:hypothetical protein